MQSLYANTRNEIQKLLTQRKSKLFLLLTVLIPVASALSLAGFQNNTGISVTFGSDFPLLILGLFTGFILPLILFMTAADSFSGEVASRTLKLVLLRPIARSKVFASKVLAITFYLALHLGIIGFVTLISGLILDGSDIFAGVFDSARASLAAFVSMMAVCMVAVFVAQWFKSSTGTLALSVIIYAAAKFLPFVFPQASVWSVFSYTDWHTLWIGSAAPWGSRMDGFVFLLSNCILLYTAALYRFDKKQF